MAPVLQRAPVLNSTYESLLNVQKQVVRPWNPQTG